MTHQRGVALLTVLLLMASIAAVGVGMTELMMRNYARSGASEARDQHFWALYGLEAAVLTLLDAEGEALDSPQHPLWSAPVVLPLDGGVATITLAPRRACFNLNDLVDDDKDGLIADEAAALRFADLVAALGASRTAGQQMAARISDFMDHDQRAQAGSAEDYDYQKRPVPYRTSRHLMMSVSELRVVQGFSQDVYRALLPSLCVLPDEGPLALNVNMLTPQDASHLVAITQNALNLPAAERLIADRPEEGYEDVAAFVANPLWANADLPAEAEALLSTAIEVIDVAIVLETAAGRLRQRSTVWLNGTDVQVIERQVGERLP